MIIARPCYLEFVGSPNKVTHFYWEQAKRIECDNTAMFSNGNIKTFIAKDTAHAAEHFAKVVGHMLRTHACGPFDPNDFVFNIYESEINDTGEFWPDCSSTDCHKYIPV